MKRKNYKEKTTTTIATSPTIVAQARGKPPGETTMISTIGRKSRRKERPKIKMKEGNPTTTTIRMEMVMTTP
jgi:hypothetical protein